MLNEDAANGGATFKATINNARFCGETMELGMTDAHRYDKGSPL